MEHLKTIWLALTILFSLSICGQRLEIGLAGDLSPGLTDKISGYEGAYRDSISLQRRIGDIKELLYSEGYLLSEAYLKLQDSTAYLEVKPGSKIYQNRLKLVYPEGLILPPGFSKMPDGGPLSYEGLQAITEYQLRLLENNGYPFARLQVKNYTIKNDTLEGKLVLEPGPFIKIDSIVVKGFDGFPKNMLRYDLELTRGMPYNEELLQNLPAKTQQIEFLRMTRPPALAFTKSQTVAYLYFEEVKSNQVDGVVGLNTTEEGEVTLNGDFRLRLLNVLKKGENFELRWRRPDENIQSLDLKTEIPYLIKTPFWLQTDLSIFRQDSSFVNTGFQGLIKYLLESGSFVSGGINYRASNVLQDSENLTTGFNSFNTTFYKLGLELRKTNRAIVPTSGYRISAYGLTGNRESNQTRQEQYSYEVFGDYYLDIQRHVIKLGLQSQALFGENLFLNELYRIGGLKTLRGFNEQSIFSSGYAIGTLEYRYMIGEYDYLTAFADVAWSETNTVNQFSSNIFTGLGAGINFRTGAGIFSLFYAIGRDNENPFDFRTSKVHFGYVNQF